MTEPKTIYKTLDDYELVEIRRKEREANQVMTINNEPLSAKQLNELIVSQSMTIDRLLTRNGEMVDALKRVRKLLKVRHYDQAMKMLDTVTG